MTEAVALNLGLGIGLTTAAILMMIPYYQLLKVVGIAKPKPTIIPPQLIKEGDGIREYSQPIVIDNNNTKMYDSFTREFKDFLWIFVWAVPVASIALASVGLANFIIYIRS